MQIQSYQIHNVLNEYRRQLSRSNTSLTQHQGGKKVEPNGDEISDEGKKKSIMEKVAASVFKKITKVSPDSEFDPEAQARVPQQSEQNWQKLQMEQAFTFNTIVGNNRKETHSIDVDNSQVLLNRLDELAKAAINRDAE
ncbi:hypothetical protein DSCO28_11830 [Desulfosarcina ovata subsp. sediminis]|uniref:Uncharacterized protein n=1 Tax=Desulfosarcina ovata subsp. sediminis TaxID=885957 RepID=A0A5K7ZKV5_9BACT|nr:DVU0524 family FlgM-associated protein [Desulfosarcina ovata]BBO80617.1 hypothetical protein DSCO28_11830 [Desulfosarcina ovata subsp. sediminis]